MDLITGKWVGKYIYGDSYIEELRGKSVPFTMELYYDGEIIRGVCIDDETKAIFSEPSKIEGTFVNPSIIFYKFYPEEKGLVGTNRLRAKEFNSTSIQYSGILKKKFLSQRRFFEGKWEIDGAFLDENGVAKYYALDGTWKMEKV